ncbi:MAG: hypothetical protein WBA98_05610 [Gordonia sp. (in: high G+C Gram-positive bacteria)]|uniref:hypothetical protein n=1 Tax=Gordonia sp. (in: high G+C Gram-positive bacteria) TaxID=84139 RepID=UPI003C739356
MARNRETYTGSSPAAFVAMAGAVLTLVSYVMPWYQVSGDPAITLTGFDAQGSSWHWYAGGSAIGVLILMIFRLMGILDWKRANAAEAFAVFGTLAAVMCVFFPNDGFSAHVGSAVALVGSVTTVVAVLLVVEARK